MFFLTVDESNRDITPGVDSASLFAVLLSCCDALKRQQCPALVYGVLPIPRVVWTALLTVFNLWVSTGPPTAHSEIYRTRGEVFFGISIALLVAFVVALRGLIRNQKRIDSQ